MPSSIVIQGRALTLSGGIPSTLQYSISAAVDHAALRTAGKGAAAVLTGSIQVTVRATGDFVPGTSTFVGQGQGTIPASTPRVLCEGAQLLTEGDGVTVTCAGTVTTTASGATAAGSASVVVSVSDGIQKNIVAGKS